MGTSGIEQFCALPRTQTRSIDDPYCHQTPCTSLGASEAAEDVPWRYEDMPNDAIKGWVGGDNGQLRAMYNGQFEAPVLPKFFVPSNFPLKHNSNDKAWACPKVGRLRCALSMDAAFRADIAEDDPEKGIYKADDGDDLQKFYDQRRHGCLLLLLEFAREFASTSPGALPGAFRHPPARCPGQKSARRRMGPGSAALFHLLPRLPAHFDRAPAARPGVAQGRRRGCGSAARPRTDGRMWLATAGPGRGGGAPE